MLYFVRRHIYDATRAAQR